MYTIQLLIHYLCPSVCERIKRLKIVHLWYWSAFGRLFYLKAFTYVNIYYFQLENSPKIKWKNKAWSFPFYKQVIMFNSPTVLPLSVYIWSQFQHWAVHDRVFQIYPELIYWGSYESRLKHLTISIKFLEFWQIILNLTCFQRTFIQNKENCTNPPEQLYFFLFSLNLRWLPFSCQYYYHDCSKVKIKFHFSSWVNL